MRVVWFLLVVFHFRLTRENLWRVIEFIGVIAEIHVGWETGFADRWRRDQVLLVRPLLDHFDGLLCGKSESRSGMERRKEGEGNVRVSCREWVVEARSHRRSARMDGVVVLWEALSP